MNEGLRRISVALKVMGWIALAGFTLLGFALKIKEPQNSEVIYLGALFGGPAWLLLWGGGWIVEGFSKGKGR